MGRGVVGYPKGKMGEVASRWALLASIALHGAVVALAEKAGLDAPANRRIAIVVLRDAHTAPTARFSSASATRALPSP